MAVHVYRYTDGSAPVLTGDFGAMVAVFDACLVNGYGTQAAAGWTKEFSAANRGVYRPPAGNRFYLRLNDNSSTFSSPYTIDSCTPQGYETMSDIDNGTGPFPSSVNSYSFEKVHEQPSDPYVIGRPRKWVLLADDRTLYFLSQPSIRNDNYGVMMFGDVYSYLSGDGYRSALIAGANGLTKREANINTAASTLRSIARSYTGSGAAINFTMTGDSSKTNAVATMAGQMQYPNPGDNMIYISPLWISEASVPTIRGRLRGCWHWLHHRAGVSDMDVFPGAGDLVGRNFLIMKDVSSVDQISAADGLLVFETSSTWDTSS